MFEKKLKALDFYSPYDFEYQDETVFRNFVSWLENQKVRLYKIEERAGLDQVASAEWPKSFEKYLNDLQLSSLIGSDRETQIEKLLSHAIRLEFSDNIDKYSIPNFAPVEEYNRQNSHDPLETIDYTSQEFRSGLEKLQKLFSIPAKPNDHTAILQALSKLIVDKFNPTAMQEALSSQATTAKNGAPATLSLDSYELGFDTNDKALNDAAKILRLLHIKELRDLQTRINETIVAVQNVTANPKTDSSLGKVGR